MSEGAAMVAIPNSVLPTAAPDQGTATILAVLRTVRKPWSRRDRCADAPAALLSLKAAARLLNGRLAAQRTQELQRGADSVVGPFPQ